MKRPDRNSFEYTNKADGKVTGTTIGSVSKDGKTLTERAKGTDPQGKPFNDVVVWDKQ